jgi:hypothetical protein
MARVARAAREAQRRERRSWMRMRLWRRARASRASAKSSRPRGCRRTSRRALGAAARWRGAAGRQRRCRGPRTYEKQTLTQARCATPRRSAALLAGATHDAEDDQDAEVDAAPVRGTLALRLSNRDSDSPKAVLRALAFCAGVAACGRRGCWPAKRGAQRRQRRLRGRRLGRRRPCGSAPAPAARLAGPRCCAAGRALRAHARRRHRRAATPAIRACHRSALAPLCCLLT